VEIVPQAVSIASHPFTGSTAFLMGNEGDGLSPAEIALCDSFVYIPHYGNGTASLNVSVAASIIMVRTVVVHGADVMFAKI
jgi:tRNA G18 (ribose-2'-O)-methylase SpoU